MTLWASPWWTPPSAGSPWVNLPGEPFRVNSVGIPWRTSSPDPPWVTTTVEPHGDPPADARVSHPRGTHAGNLSRGPPLDHPTGDPGGPPWRPAGGPTLWLPFCGLPRGTPLRTPLRNPHGFHPLLTTPGEPVDQPWEPPWVPAIEDPLVDTPWGTTPWVLPLGFPPGDSHRGTLW